MDYGLTIIWIYTTLKLYSVVCRLYTVWLSYEFTLLSNNARTPSSFPCVWLSYEFTLLSNELYSYHLFLVVWLSYEFTLLSNFVQCFPHVQPVWLSYEFTLLSNLFAAQINKNQFDYHMNLHYSQTIVC